ncbi:hypothetical protein VTI74DRAFT_7671 [Chaetomium olivicolor]
MESVLTQTPHNRAANHCPSALADPNDLVILPLSCARPSLLLVFDPISSQPPSRAATNVAGCPPSLFDVLLGVARPPTSPQSPHRQTIPASAIDPRPFRTSSAADYPSDPTPIQSPPTLPITRRPGGRTDGATC